MAFDYDLVILGGSLVARYAAARASGLRARVALVEPATARAELALLRQSAFRQLRMLLEQTGKLAAWGLCPTVVPNQLALGEWEQALVWIRETTAEIAASESMGPSLSQLAASGVDIVLGEAAFYPGSKPTSARSRRPPVVLINGRYLRSRQYLLAAAALPAIPKIEGLGETNYRTIDSFWHNPWTTLPQHLTVLGSDPRGIALAQLFNRLGCQVALIVSTPQLLPDQEGEAIGLLQAHLEAEGIEILTQTWVTQVKQLGHQTWIQAGDQALQTDALLLATQVSANLDAFNLRAVGVEGDRRLSVNRKLQTTHPCIYACGDVLGGHTPPHLAEHEADVAIQNALFGSIPFGPTAHVNYGQIPWAIFTSPTLARVGLTASQARAVYGEEVLVVQHRLPSCRAQVQQEPIGWCQLVVRRNGEILGGQSLSAQAEEWIGVIALAMKHRIKLGAIDPSAFLSATSSEILTHLIRQWQDHRLPSWQRDGWESWFNLRRS